MVTRDTRFKLVDGYNLQIGSVRIQDAGDYVCKLVEHVPSIVGGASKSLSSFLLWLSLNRSDWRSGGARSGPYRRDFSATVSPTSASERPDHGEEGQHREPRVQGLRQSRPQPLLAQKGEKVISSSHFHCPSSSSSERLLKIFKSNLGFSI